MEMTLVNRFSYPPVTVVDEDVKNQMISKEHQMALVCYILNFNTLTTNVQFYSFCGYQDSAIVTGTVIFNTINWNMFVTMFLT